MMQKVEGHIRVRLAAFGAVVFLSLFAWFGVRSQIGNMLGEFTSPTRADAADAAELAASLAPNDPRTRWLAAATRRRNFTEEAVAESVALLEEAVRLAPYDFRYWVELGRAYEQAEQFENSEKALQRAVELAPSYAYPRWQLGNFLIRDGRMEEALPHLKLITEKGSIYRIQVFSLIWDLFGKDPAQVEAIASDSTDSYADLAWFYAERFAGKDALRAWNALDKEQKIHYAQIRSRLLTRLYDIGALHEALEILREQGISDAGVGKIANGGFESGLTRSPDVMFGWQLYLGDKGLDIATDGQVKVEGNRSARLTFRGYSNPELHELAQKIPVDPGAAYRLTFRLRTEELRSGGPPMLAVDVLFKPLRLAETTPFPTGTNNWQSMPIDFVVPENASAVIIRTVRASCSGDCPIFGTIWYDDFRLEKVK